MVTVLHLADPQFGVHHGFAGVGLTADDRRHDSLAARLLDDLAYLRTARGLAPDLVVVAGDLAEWAGKEEYAQAREFLAELGEGLRLGPNRTVLVPGNHDVNRGLAEIHFLESKAYGTEPVPPYWRKWELFANELFRPFYGTEFPRDEPWLLTECAELKVVVAGLNSTMAESHRDEDHYGWLGEHQLRWFDRRMCEAQRKGWLRIGVLHHNPVRGAGADDAHLRDVDRFVDVLAPRLNLVLHGHTHDARIHHLGPSALPVLAAGSAGVAASERPPEVPNQYQLVRIHAGGLQVWARQYVPGRRSWIGDNRVSEHGDTWCREVSCGFSGAHAAFPTAPPTPVASVTRVDDGRRGRRLGPERDQPTDPEDHLLAQVAEVCRLRLPAAKVTEVISPDGDDPDYLRVEEPLEGGVGRPVAIAPYPIGVCGQAVTREHLTRFLEVVRRFRTGGTPVAAALICADPALDEKLVEWAAGRGIRLLTFAQYQLGDELATYARQQDDRLRRDTVYRSSLYIPQRYTEISLFDRLRYDEPRSDLLHRLRGWLRDPDGHLVVVLGPFGHGKTFLLRELARRMYADRDPTVPILVHLRDLEKVHGLDELVAAQLVHGGERRPNIEMFRYLLREGRVALLFDGFDELALRVSYDRAADHLEQIVRATEGRAKVVLTSRDHHFHTDAQVATAVTTALGDRLMSVAGRRMVKVDQFDDAQIMEYLTRLLGDGEAVRQRFELLRGVNDLLGLCRNPRMLDFITTYLDDDRLRSARDGRGGTKTTPATLYQELVERWLGHEWQRLRSLGAGFSIDALWLAATDLALRLWRSTEPSLGVEDLGAAADAVQALAPPAAGRPGDRTPPNRPLTSHMIGANTLLVRDGDGRFTFVHRSVMEWLVARHVADGLAAGQDVTALPEPVQHRMSQSMIEFLYCLAGEEAARAWTERILTDPQASAAAGDTALRLDRFLRLDFVQHETREPARLGGRDLRGQDLSGQRLRGADLSGADLTEAQLVNADLSGANLTGAILVRARLDGCDMTGASLREADLTGASLLGVDLTDADLTAAVLRRAALIGATVAPQALASADTSGAALPAAGLPEVQFRASATGMLALAVGADGTTLASGDTDGTVRMWRADTGVRVGELAPQPGGVNALAFSPDGQWLASAGTTVRIWPARDGDPQPRELAGHAGPVGSLAFSRDGRWLATGGEDGTVRLWDPATGKHLRELVRLSMPVGAVAAAPSRPRLAVAGDRAVHILDARTGRRLRDITGHTDRVSAVAYSPDGRWLATGSHDGTARIWTVETGDQLHRLAGHPGAVWSVAFSPDGRWLATAGDDRKIRLWDTRTGAQVHQLIGHTEVVGSVAFSPTGRWLFSVGDDRTVRIWDAGADQLCATLLPLDDGGWAALASDLRYKVTGVPSGEFWYGIGACRFEPGELDPYVRQIIRVPGDTVLLPDEPA